MVKMLSVIPIEVENRTIARVVSSHLEDAYFPETTGLGHSMKQLCGCDRWSRLTRRLPLCQNPKRPIVLFSTTAGIPHSFAPIRGHSRPFALEMLNKSHTL
jgi:hypothetical protein